MRTNLEAAEHPVVLLTSAFVTWRVYGMRSILLCHHNVKGIYSVWELLGHCPGVTTVQYDGQYVNHAETKFYADRDWWLPNTAVRLCYTVASYADSSPDFSVTASIFVLCAFKVDEELYKFHICVAYSNSILGARWIANLLYLCLRPVDL